MVRKTTNIESIKIICHGLPTGFHLDAFSRLLKGRHDGKGEGNEVSSYSKCLMERGKTGFCGAGLKAIRGNPKQAMVGFRNTPSGQTL
jgi:hypothetical protein